MGAVHSGETGSTRSASGSWPVEQLHLLIVRRLEDSCPSLEVSPRYGCGRPLARCVAPFCSLDQFLQRRIQVVQFDSNSEGSRTKSLLIPFDPCPMTP